jgi:Zn-dependent protease with chaperone function
MKDKPREIRWVIYCLIVLILMNVASLLIFFTENAAVAESLVVGLQRTLPSFSGDNLKDLVSEMLITRNMFHLFTIVCWAVLTYAVYKGKSWGRLLLVLFTLLSFLGTIYLYSTSDFLSLQIIAVVGWVGRIVLLWLLLIPVATKEYFRTSRIMEGSTI